jgi:replicative DNA helicase
MDTLTDRAERAVLGAMIASPAARDTLRQLLRPGDFRDPWHQRVYRAIASVSEGGLRDPAGLRVALAEAEPYLTEFDLDELAESCPDPGHGTAYGHMLVVAASRRSLAGHGRDLAIRGMQLSRDADVIRRLDDAGADALAVDAGHYTRLGDALRAHAETLAHGRAGPKAPMLRYPITRQARHEELVLAALVHLNPDDAAEVLQALGRATMTDPYRQEAIEVLTSMARNGRPIDELTLDWAIAQRGLPLQPNDGGATFGQRLARTPVNLPDALTAAQALQGRQAGTDPAPQHGVPGIRRVTGARQPGYPASSQRAPILRLHRNGLPPDGPDPGPRPR